MYSLSYVKWWIVVLLFFMVMPIADSILEFVDPNEKFIKVHMIVLALFIPALILYAKLERALYLLKIIKIADKDLFSNLAHLSSNLYSNKDTAAALVFENDARCYKWKGGSYESADLKFLKNLNIFGRDSLEEYEKLNNLQLKIDKLIPMVLKKKHPKALSKISLIILRDAIFQLKKNGAIQIERSNKKIDREIKELYKMALEISVFDSKYDLVELSKKIKLNSVIKEIEAKFPPIIDY